MAEPTVPFVDLSAQPISEITDFKRMPFAQASSRWLESRRPFLKDRTFRDYLYCQKWLVKCFGDKTLAEITADDIRDYQRTRSERCGPQMINHETCILQLENPILGCAHVGIVQSWDNPTASLGIGNTENSGERKANRIKTAETNRDRSRRSKKWP